jgi:hypothetical protein
MQRWAAVFCLAFLGGCAGAGEVLPLDLHALPRAGQTTTDQQPLTVLVVPFEDRRSDKGWVGTRTHLWGGTTHFDLLRGQSGEVLGKVFAEYLRQHGWRAFVGTEAPSDQKPDVMLRGQVHDLVAHAKSRFGSTKITARAKLALQVLNMADGSAPRLALNGARTESVIWFEPQDVEALINEVLRESFEKLLADTKVEGRTLQVR